ncbi:hypothetical protein F5884DRAFT_879400 [Xylogone sp. PMI_703]|nr:hypothetical protein F5884DRAFT_879400 [Xylogone sp. PMI_703]
MPALVIPEAGMRLGSSASRPVPAVPEVFALTLSDAVVQEMIKCAESGKQIQLSLGDAPAVLYGSKVQPLATTELKFTQELYHTSTESRSPNMPIKVTPRTHTRWLSTFAPKGFELGKRPAPAAARTPASTTSQLKDDAIPAGGDAALAQLQRELATENAKKAENTQVTKLIAGLPVPGRRGAKSMNKSKLLGRSSATPKSMPTSPALNGVASPSLGPTSVPLSQQRAEQAKATRRPIVHYLALAPMTEKELQEKIDGSDNDIKQMLEKVGDLKRDTGKWELRKNFWKELDVWAFDYDTSDDRQRAIDNAVRQYDKMRIGVSEPEWERLLHKSERGTGKCLSKLQAQIATGSARPPKSQSQRNDTSDHGTPQGDDDEDLFGDKPASEGNDETMARSSSQQQQPAPKTKKISEKEAQVKRLLSKNPLKSAVKTSPKPATKPASKPGPKPGAKKEKAPKAGGRILSSEFVSDSDDDNYAVPQKTTTPTVTKRAREEDTTASSDSGVPLSKKVKKDLPTHRASDVSQTSRFTNTSLSSTSNKTKGTSPQKSSPLASSPPTNASDMDNSSSNTSSSTSPYRHVPSEIKARRKHDNNGDGIRRHQKSSSSVSSTSSTGSRYLKPEVLDLARKYKMFYPKYEALHRKLSSMGDQGGYDPELQVELMDMHERLSKMKSEIIAGIVEA